MFGAAAVCRNIIRRSAVRAEAPPCGGSQNLQIPVLNGARPADFGTRTSPALTMKQSLRTKQRALSLNKADAACGGGRQPKRRASAPDCGPRDSANCKTIENRWQTTANEQRFSFKPPRHYAASGLLNLLTTLAQAVACTTPGTPTAFRGKPYGRTNYRR
mgnify:CR=1 FL=1